MIEEQRDAFMFRVIVGGVVRTRGQDVLCTVHVDVADGERLHVMHGAIGAGQALEVARSEAAVDAHRAEDAQGATAGDPLLGHRDVQAAITIQIGDAHAGRVPVRGRDERSVDDETPMPIAEQQRAAAAATDGDVEAVILVEVGRGDGVRVARDWGRDRSGERPAAAIQEAGDGGSVGVRGDQVVETVPVAVNCDEAGRLGMRSERDGGAERSITEVEELIHRRVDHARHRDVEVPVCIKIDERQTAGARTGAIEQRGSECPVSIPKQDRDRITVPERAHQVGLAIAVDVARPKSEHTAWQAKAHSPGSPRRRIQVDAHAPAGRRNAGHIRESVPVQIGDDRLDRRRVRLGPRAQHSRQVEMDVSAGGVDDVPDWIGLGGSRPEGHRPRAPSLRRIRQRTGSYQRIGGGACCLEQPGWGSGRRNRRLRDTHHRGEAKHKCDEGR